MAALYARTLRDRTVEHQPRPIVGNKPIAVGHGFSTIAWIPEAQGSWALPLRHERITSFETPISRAAFQLKQVCKQLPVRPIATYDSEYGNASFVKQTAGIEADLLLRLRSNMCLWGAPPPYSGRDGQKFMVINLNWLTPTLGESLLPHGDRRPEVGNSCDSTRLLGYTSAPLLCISYKCYGLSFLASMLASAPQADVAGLAG
jgi:hypothetical protein